MGVYHKSQLPIQTYSIASAPAAVTAKRLVDTTGEQCTSNEVPLGVAAYDADLGSELAVLTAGILTATAGSQVTAGNTLQAGDNGKVVPVVGTNKAYALAVESATSGNDLLIKMPI